MLFKETSTKPRPLHSEGSFLAPEQLVAGRYGTEEMVSLWGLEQTFDFQLKVQGQAALTLSSLYPDVVPKEHADEIARLANLDNVDAERISALEAKTGHDVIAVNTALEERLSSDAVRAHVNKGKTSADTTQPARGLQLKASLEVLAESVENLRDIVLEKSVLWKDAPHMDTTHLYDALPTVAGRPFAHYGEMLQSGLEVLSFVHGKSLKGKWSDATGNYHSVKALGLDGSVIEEKYCSSLGLGHMIASAQVPGLEFEADVFYSLARIGETINNLARYVANGRSDDCSIFVNARPRRHKGSSAMPHKDAKNGNPTDEEQVMSVANWMRGAMTTALSNCEMPYARNLSASANGRVNLETGFNLLDQGIRKLAGVVYWLGLNEERARERVNRSFGVVTAQRVMTYLTDHRSVSDPLPRTVAHDILGKLATEAWNTKTQFIDVLRQNSEVTSRIDDTTLVRLADPNTYIGESQIIIDKVYKAYHGKKTFG